MKSLRLLISICVYCAIRSLGTAWLTLHNIDLYRSVNAAGSPSLRIGLNAAFGFGLMAVAWGLFKRRTWAYQILLPIIAAYITINGVWLATYAQSDYDRGRVAFSVVTSALSMGFIWWLRRRLRKEFGEQYDG